MIIKIPIEVSSTGTGLKSTVAGLEAIEKQARKTEEATSRGTKRMGEFADSVGRTSTTLARSADAFGLPTQALRTLDDVMDVAELGLNNLSKAGAGFNAASIGIVGAGLAIGTAIGSWLNTFPAVQKAADSLFHSMFRMVGLAGEVNKSSTQGLKEFSASMGAKHAEALAKQVKSMREQGQTGKEIAKFYGENLTEEMKKRLGLSEKALKAEEAILKAHQKQKDELAAVNALFRNEKSLTELYKAGTSVSAKQFASLGGGIATSMSSGANTRATVSAQGPDLFQSIMGGGIATSLSLSYSQEMELGRKSKEQEREQAERLVSTFGTLSQQLTNLSQVVGGFAGKLLGIVGSLSSGAGGILSGLQGWKQSGGGGIMGTLGKLSSGLGIFGSAIGAVGGLIGGIKSLFGGKSKEEKAAEAAAKRQAEEDRKAAVEAARQAKLDGLRSAQAAAESLMDRMSKGGFSEGLTASLGTLIGKVQDALLKSGLGYMAMPGLRDSQAFMGAQGAAGDVAQLLGGMRAGGALDSGLLAAAGASATELQAQAVAAAEAAGLAPAEATKAGFGAIAPLLREQLNASLASGQELDANTKALIEEARKNGIEIIADPMVESVAVQKDMLGELKRLSSGGYRPPDEQFARGTRGLRRLRSDMVARVHAGEGMMVIPRDEMASMGFGSFARGYYDDAYDPRNDRIGTLNVGATSVTGSTGTGDSSGSAAYGGSSPSSAAPSSGGTAVAAVRVEQPVSIQVIDNSPVKTVEGQRAFGQYVVSEIERALDQNARGLESRIERIARRAVA